MSIWETISADIHRITGDQVDPRDNQSLSGGCINQAARLSGKDRNYFVKLNQAERVEMFAAEAEGLQAIADSQTLRVPQPLCWDVSGPSAYLVLEFLEIGGHSSNRDLGAGLAAMHADHRPQFGWHRENTIGSTPQHNPWGDDWIDFWRTQRLGFQLRLAASNGHTGRLQDTGAALLEVIDQLFTDYQPAPSLLHGDLWSGNYATLDGGIPVIFDPAVYYGDRETDIAMTELFGGFGSDFYAAYREVYPLDPGYSIRKTLYNLYHILNHLNLFGGGYLSQAETMMNRLLDELDC